MFRHLNLTHVIQYLKLFKSVYICYRANNVTANKPDILLHEIVTMANGNRMNRFLLKITNHLPRSEVVLSMKFKLNLECYMVIGILDFTFWHRSNWTRFQLSPRFLFNYKCENESYLIVNIPRVFYFSFVKVGIMEKVSYSMAI